MQEENQDMDKPKMEIPELNIKFGEDHVEIDDYIFYFDDEIINELMQWTNNTDKTGEQKKKTLLYLCKTLTILKPYNETEMGKMITELETHEDVLEKYIDATWDMQGAEIKIPELDIKIGEDYVEIDDYKFYFGDIAINGLTQWLKTTKKTGEQKRKTLMYLCKALTMLEPEDEEEARKTITELETYEDVFEKYINKIFEEEYE